MNGISPLLVVVICSLFHCTDALTCYNCSGLSSAAVCNQTVVCQLNEVCYQQVRHQSSGSVVDLGCKDIGACRGKSTTGGGANLIGRSASVLLRSRQMPECHECCGSDLCNRNICSHMKPSACTDDPSLDCPRMNSLFSICSDLDHAKSVCPKFCDLCDVVDGAWSLWTTWSQCDVTCSNGTRTRNRACTSPAPANGGSDCVGNSLETQPCSKPRCPIHGEWSMWSPWGECSVTCDVGLERRDRTCSNPYPDIGGDHCFGDSRDDRVCMTKACADGGWSSWQNWETCSVTCDGGNRRRHRSCDNPAPSAFGRACTGTDTDIETCNVQACSDGGWSSWQSWGTCSVTCDGGNRRRHRSCDNPAPSVFGKVCIGTDTDIETCNVQACSGDTIAFQAVHITTMKNNILVFSNVLLNEGGGYNNTSGYFIAPKPGVYQFTAQLCTHNGLPVAFLMYRYSDSGVRTTSLGRAYASLSNDWDCDHLSAVTRLNTNERVAVHALHSINHIILSPNETSVFTGVKISN